MIERIKNAFFTFSIELIEKHLMLGITLALTILLALMVWSSLIVGEGNFLLGTKKIFYLEKM